MYILIIYIYILVYTYITSMEGELFLDRAGGRNMSSYRPQSCQLFAISGTSRSAHMASLPADCPATRV